MQIAAPEVRTPDREGSLASRDVDRSLDALAIRVPGLFRVTPLTGVSLKFTPDPYAKVTPLSEAQQRDYTLRLEADYRAFGERDKVDATIKQLGLTLIPALREAERAGDAAVAKTIAENVPLFEKLIDVLASAALKRAPVVGTASLGSAFVDERGVLSGEWYPAPMVRYHMFGKAGATPEVQQFARVLGTCAVLIARDTNGDEWIQIQARHPVKNFPHCGNPGVSPAGFFRPMPEGPTAPQIYARHLLGDLDRFGDLNDSAVLYNLCREAREEIGLVDRALVVHEVIGHAFDEVSPHDELLNRLRSKLSRDEMTACGWDKACKLASEAKRLGKDMHPHDFAERFGWVRAKPENIRKLVVGCVHGPGTHIGNLYAEGIARVREERGVRAADSWARETADMMSDAWSRCSETVANHYRTHPQDFFAAVHPRENRALEDYRRGLVDVSPQELMQRLQAKQTSVPYQMFHRLSEEETPPEVCRQYLEVALAMLDGRIHTPSSSSYDPRRTPESQGMPKAPDAIMSIGSGEVSEGTLFKE